MTKTPSTARPVAASYICAIGLPTLGMSAGMVTLAPVLLGDTDAAVAVADRRRTAVALHVLVGHVEFEAC